MYIYSLEDHCAHASHFSNRISQEVAHRNQLHYELSQQSAHPFLKAQVVHWDNTRELKSSVSGLLFQLAKQLEAAAGRRD